jgi:hypothetical protein
VAEHSDSMSPEASVTGYRRKPPLWQPSAKEPWTWATGLAIAAFLLVALVVLPLGLESYFLAVPLGQLEVTVVQVESGSPQEETPAEFRHIVALPDGSRKRFVAARIYRPGEKLVVTVSRGRITQRIWLGAPYAPAPGQ